jgi:hypothetical protein
MPVPTETVTGTVRAEGDAVAGAEVLLFGPGERPTLLATGTTGADGSFALAPGGGAKGPLAVLARLKGEVVGVAAREVEAARPVELDLAGPARTLTIAVAGDAGRPDALVLALEPDAPADVPERLRPFVDQTAPGVFAGRFLTRELTGETLTVRVLPGRWRIAGESLNHDRPNIPAPDFRNYVVAAARSEPDGAPLPGGESAGFALDVDRDRRVTVVLREVPDAEL